jgi:hypothetical protein
LFFGGTIFVCVHTVELDVTKKRTATPIAVCLRRIMAGIVSLRRGSRQYRTAHSHSSLEECKERAGQFAIGYSPLAFGEMRIANSKQWPKLTAES